MAESPKRSVSVVSPTLPGVTDEPAEPEGTICPSDSPPKIMPELDDSVAASDLLTTTMIAEEEEMKKKTEDDQERLLQEHQQSCGSLSEDLREQRYKRLQFLLSKSNMYTNYLLERMEKQAEEEKQKQERREKKKQIKEEKPKKENKEVRTSSRSTRTKVEPAPAAAPAPSRKRKATGSEQPSKKKRKMEVDEDSDEDELSSPTSQSTTDSQESTTVKKETEDAEQDADSKKVDNFMAGLSEEDQQPELLIGGTLRPYQMEGYKWLKVLYENGVNGILADEMGLGKTIQCISAIADMCAHAVPGPFLVIAPLSVVPNWVNEFKRFAPAVPVILYHGTKDDRARLRRKINRTYECKPGVRVQPVVVTSYEVTMNDRASLANFPWKYLIVDEGHRIKNSQCRLIKELKMYSSTHRLLLTGTPLQNNLAELWSLLNFLLPEIFDDLASFETWFDLTRLDNKDNHKAIVAEEQRDQVLTMLHQILKPFMLRRMKCDVELDVPPKSEVMVYAPLSNEQTVMYKAALDNTIEEMLYEEKDVPEETLGRGNRERKKIDYNSMCDAEEDEAPAKENKKKHEDDLYAWCDNFIIPELKSALDRIKKKRGTGKTEVHLQLRNKMMLMRKICNHPYLISYPLTAGGEYLVSEAMIKECGKMQLLDQMMTELINQGHKVLVFSQMTSMLDIIGDYLYHRGLKHSRLDGSLPFQERMVQIDQFNQDADVNVFLLSTRAGGLGLNLTAADTVIIYDSDWNPQCDLQAQDRCHRIGQTKPVVIYRLVTSNTIDQRIVERAAAKRKLEKLVIIKGKFKKGIQNFEKEMKPLTAEELMELLESKDFQAKVEIQKRRGKEQAISQKDLLKLLDRSHLWRQWEEKKKQRAEIANGVKKEEVDEVKEEEVEEEEEEHAVEGVFKTLETIQY